MITCYYKVNISPGDEKEKSAPSCIYLSFKSSNKMYLRSDIRTACQLYTLEEVPNRQAILPLDYKKLGNVSSSPLVKVNVFLNSSVTDSLPTDVATAAPSTTPGKGVASPVLPVTPSSASSSSSSSVRIKKFQIIACRTGANLYTICTTILALNTLKIDGVDWKIQRVTAIDRLLVDVRA